MAGGRDIRSIGEIAALIGSFVVVVGMGYLALRLPPVCQEPEKKDPKKHRPTLAATAAELPAPEPNPAEGVLNVPWDDLTDLCQRSGVRQLALVIFHDFKAGDPYDMLVEFAPGRTPGLWLFHMEDYLSHLFDRHVWLHTTAGFPERQLDHTRTLFPKPKYVVEIAAAIFDKQHPPPSEHLAELASELGWSGELRPSAEHLAELAAAVDQPVADLQRSEPREPPESAAKCDPDSPLPLGEVGTFCRTWRIGRLTLFGRALQRDFHPCEGLDLLADFEPGHGLGLVFFRIEEELAALLDRSVRLGTPGFLGTRLDQARQEGQVIHGRP